MKLSFSSLLWGIMLLGLPASIIVSCKKSDSTPPPTAPAVSTTALTNVTTTSATTGGTILTDGHAAITQSGIVWSKTNAMPTLNDSVIANTTTSGSFTTSLANLDFNRTYYIRAFATNSIGTGYGDVVTLNTTNDTSKVRFTYNGKEVIYGIIISSVTGKKWLDRNLGATQVATSLDDYKAYGDLFQWGRPADGHQLITWTSSTTGTAVNGTSTELANSDTPANSKFIIYPDNTTTGDWRSDNNQKRWATNPQGPCPAGWHVPTITEWRAEISITQNSAGGTATSPDGIANYSKGYNQLKLTIAGLRYTDGPPNIDAFLQANRVGRYWTTTDRFKDGYSDAADIEFGASYVQADYQLKGWAMSIRCLKN